MRGRDTTEQRFFSYVMPEDRVPQDHPLRPIKKMVNRALTELSTHFTSVYSRMGRPSIPPEMQLRATLLQILYSIRSERLLMEQLEYNILFRWFVGLSMDDPVWDHSVFSKNRERLLNTDVAAAFFASVRQQAEEARLLSDEHFTVDGTLIEAWASLKSFRPKDDAAPPAAGSGRNPEVDFHGQQRTNDTHESTTDPDARLYRKGKGKEARLSYMGHVLMENRNGLAVDGHLTQASGTAEPEAALAMLSSIAGEQRITVGADKFYDQQAFVQGARGCKVTPHVAARDRGSAIDGRTTRHAGYEISQRTRKRIEEIFGWLKTIGTLSKVKLRGHPKVESLFTFALAAYNLVRIRNLLSTASP
jgi:transposase